MNVFGYFIVTLIFAHTLATTQPAGYIAIVAQTMILWLSY